MITQSRKPVSGDNSLSGGKFASFCQNSAP